MRSSLSLPIEVRYEIATAAIAGAAYLIMGTYMAARASDWPRIAFAMMPRTRSRAVASQTPKTLRFVRTLGVCFALLATTMLYIGAQRYRWIKEVQAFDAAHPLPQ